MPILTTVSYFCGFDTNLEGLSRLENEKISLLDSQKILTGDFLDADAFGEWRNIFSREVSWLCLCYVISAFFETCFFSLLRPDVKLSSLLAGFTWSVVLEQSEVYADHSSESSNLEDMNFDSFLLDFSNLLWARLGLLAWTWTYCT